MRLATLIGASVLALTLGAFGIVALSRVAGYKGGWPQVGIGLTLIGLAAALAGAVVVSLEHSS